MGKRYDLVAVQVYTQNGEEKKRYINCGVVLDTKSGGMCIKLESLPVVFDGWLQMFEPKPKEQQRQPGDDFGE